MMRTFVTVTVSSEGEKASRVLDKFKELGFKTSLGNHDFYYEWNKKEVSPQNVIDLVDRVQDSLKGMNVRMHFVTIK
ncbi:MAG TPA: hypothetical protein ENN76_02580 [Euryarchaeota archaeon]|nr:hypothetical protein [Euryarchaeota archaeon]